MHIKRGVLASILGAGLLLGAACSSSNGGLTATATPVEDQAEATATSGTSNNPTATNTSTSTAVTTMTTAELVEFAGPSVVRVSLPTGVGSGFIIDASGYIVTNNHVVESAPQAVQVTLADGSVYDALVVGRDPRADLAVLKIEPRAELAALALADIDATKVGEDVVAIGYALDLSNGSGPPSVTRGIVSALNREAAGSGLGAIQTDAAINHGNSGGPLLNYKGEVLGVNTSLAPDPATGGVAQNVGFAVGADTISAVYDEILAIGRVDRALLGIGGDGEGAGFSTVRPAEAEELGLPRDTTGVLVGVAGVNPAGPAAVAGMEGNDLIVRIGDYEVEDESDLAVAMIDYDPGDVVEVDVYRDGELLTLTLNLGTPTSS
jgi:S1-C subfamily serine protease